MEGCKVVTLWLSIIHNDEISHKDELYGIWVSLIQASSGNLYNKLCISPDDWREILMKQLCK